METNPQSGRIDFLRGIPLFAGLGEADLAALAGDFAVRKYDRDEVIFHQGDDSHELYVIRQGKVRVFTTSPGGNETSMVIFAAGGVIGEVSAADGRFRSATARAIEPSTLLAMPQARVVEHLRRLPDLALAFIRLMADKVRWTTEYAEALVQFDTAGRLLYLILHYNAQFGRERVPGQVYELDLGLSQGDLATLVGARREWVNRILHDWRRRGLLDVRGGTIVILDLPRARAELDSRTAASQNEDDL